MSAAAIPPGRLLAFLADMRSYGGKCAPVRVLQTHASFVAIAGRFVFKVKERVNFGFLDFSTLEKRRHFCEREVLLNRRLSPGVYLGVVPISLNQAGLVFGIRGEIVEYAVKMRHLPERYFLPRLLREGKVAARDVDAIVATLVPFYGAHDPTPEIAGWGRIGKLRISTSENFRQLKRFAGETISRPALDAIRLYTGGFFHCHAALFAARVREGRIRDCHGDLHLDHIHLGPSRLAIFDCIEFNDRFRCIDVASDAAFLAMDFDFHGRPDLSRRFAVGMARALADPGMLQLLDFYKCYRAVVRGKVESLREFPPGAPDAEWRECRARAERYLRLALQYAIAGSQPIVLIVMGSVGSGKSTLAQSLQRELGWEVFSSDRIRKELGSVPLQVRGSKSERRTLYSRKMSDKTYAALTRSAVDEVRKQRSVILDATFSSRHRRIQLLKALASSVVDHCFVETRAGAAVIKGRLEQRASAPGEISDARIEDLTLLARAWEPPTEVDAHHFLAVKSGRACGATVLAALRALARRRSRRAAPG